MVIDNREKVLSLIRIKGPVVPSQIKNEIESSILIASATLGELASKNHLKISHLKVGGSPLYYLPGQEDRLQSFAEKLSEQEKKAYDLLRQQVVLRDLDLTPLTRVALRQIKDFAIPLQVNNNGNIEVFWKWYLTPNNQADTFIKKILVPLEEKPKEAAKPVVEKVQETPKVQELQKTLVKPITEKKEAKKPVKKPRKADDFLEKINNYFELNKIEVIEKNIIKKNSELDFVIKVPSAVGSLIYFCKAKNKKRVGDGDLGSAYVQGQVKKLPVLVLVVGELTKKAEAMLESEFKGMGVKLV